MFLFGRHGADDADVAIAPECIFEQVREFGLSVWDVRAKVSVWRTYRLDAGSGRMRNF